MDVSRLGAGRLGIVAGVLGALVAVVLGFLTVGVQATAAPRGMPLAVAVPDGPAGQALAPVVARLTQESGDAVAWRAVDPATAQALLDDAEIYGVLQLNPGAGPVVIVSGAVNPSGTQVAQQVLTGAGQALAAAMAQQSGAAPAPVQVQVVHPVSAAGRTLPLAATALLWLASLVASAAYAGLALRGERGPSIPGRLAAAATATVLGPIVVLGFVLLWDSGLSVPGGAVAFLVLTAAAFALLQGAVLRLLGLAGMALLVPLYLVAPAVAGQVPELLHPAYRVLLWSWSPFRFSTEGLRGLLAGLSTPAVGTGVAVLGTLAVLGLVVLVWPSRRAAQPAVPDREPAAVS